jgi:cold-inducible RNA-binding protein
MQEKFMTTKLYVGNLPYETTESDLQALFEAAGQVSTISIVRDRATGQARGFAFVEMSDVESAQRAINELDKQQYGRRRLRQRPSASRPALVSHGAHSLHNLIARISARRIRACRFHNDVGRMLRPGRHTNREVHFNAPDGCGR